MPDSSTANLPPLDLAHIDDPEVRRALRSLQADFAGKLSQMQVQIDAMVQMMVDKHLGSLGEFRREVAKLQQDHGKLERIHGAMSGTPSPHPAAPVIRTVAPGGTVR
ncbi:MAG: hypothetical protein ABSH20_12020 [Tepidisphaeraceae bacterium]|jgi:hypothetical protein